MEPNDIPEAQISAEFVTLFSPKFKLYPQVWLMHPSKGRLKIDFIGQPTCGKWQGNIGFELKKGGIANKSFSDWSNAVAQAIDYSQSKILSDAIGGKDWFGHTLKYVFLYPCPFLIADKSPSSDRHTEWARGQMRLAGKYGVGAAEFVEDRSDWVLSLGTEPAYWLSRGPTSMGMKHAVGERIGADR